MISGNSVNGVNIHDSGTNQNVVAGNFIGTDASGRAPLGNQVRGVIITGGAQGNLVGTDGDGVGDAAERNVISANVFDGVGISGPGTTGNVVAGNFIGTDVTGLSALGNRNNGVAIGGGAQSNRIGTNGTDVDPVGERNVIAGSLGDGVFIGDPGTNANVVAGNFIGTDATGTKPLGNAGNGVQVLESASANTIGGTVAGARNIISASGVDGIELFAGVTGNLVAGNYIGTDVSGTKPLGNANQGVAIFSSASANTIGGTVAGARNIVSGNGGEGIRITDGGSSGNLVEGNFIGTDVTGAKPLDNAADGVSVLNGASNNTIGGTVGWRPQPRLRQPEQWHRHLRPGHHRQPAGGQLHRHGHHRHQGGG